MCNYHIKKRVVLGALPLHLTKYSRHCLWHGICNWELVGGKCRVNPNGTATSGILRTLSETKRTAATSCRGLFRKNVEVFYMEMISDGIKWPKSVH
jgi:hypothetical protein